MQRYSKDSNTKNDIMNAAEKLFYENGYNDTFLDEIANEAGVTKGLITYYFKSKIALANNVNNRVFAKQKNYITQKIYDKYSEYDPQVGVLVENRIQFKMWTEDKYAGRFWYELLKYDTGDSQERLDQMIRFYKSLFHKLNIQKTSDELRLMALAVSGVTRSIYIAFFEGTFSCSGEEVLKFISSSKFIYLGFTSERIKFLLDESLKIEQQLDVRIKPYFKLE